MRPSLRRFLVLAGVFMLGTALGRFVVPRFEWRTEVNAIAHARNGECGFAVSTTEFLLGQPRRRIDGGKGLQCGERWPLSKDAFIYCECD